MLELELKRELDFPKSRFFRDFDFPKSKFLVRITDLESPCPFFTDLGKSASRI